MDLEKVLEVGLLGASFALSIVAEAKRSPPSGAPPKPSKPGIYPEGDEVVVPLYNDVIEIRASVPIPWDRIPRGEYEVHRLLGISPIKDEYVVDVKIGEVDPSKKLVRDSVVVVDGSIGDYLNYAIALVGGGKKYVIAKKRWSYEARALVGGIELASHVWNHGLKGGYKPIVSWLGRLDSALVMKLDLDNVGAVASLNGFREIEILYDWKVVLAEPATELPRAVRLPASRGEHSILVRGVSESRVFIEFVAVKIP